MTNYLRMFQLSLAAVGLAFLLTTPSQAAGELSIRAGLAVTNNPSLDGRILLEFPFSVNRSQFQFFRPDSTDALFYARVFAQVVLIDSRGLPIDSTNTYFSLRARSAAEAAASDQRVFNQLSLLVAPGVYTARLTVIDAASKAEGEVFYDDVVAAPARSNRLTIGGARLAYQITAVDSAAATDDRMTKNGLKVLTNPIGLFGTADSILYLYAELYSLVFDSAAPSTYQVGFCILNESDGVVRDFGVSKRRKPGPTAVIAQPLDITGLSPGMYSLELAAADPAAGQADTARLVFRIISPEEVALMAATYRSDVDVYDSLSLEQQVHVATFQLTPDQRSTLQELSDEGKANFLAQFWQDHDELPGTPFNETRAEMVRRYLYCNRNFSVAGDSTGGWRTDRGRIYMTYGVWDDQDNNMAPIIGQPFSIWYYRHLDEGLVFVFADLQGFGDFTLVHSNADGEHFDDEWDRRVRDQSFLEFEQDFDFNN